MIFANAEIDVLRLTAWCKDLPKDNTEMIPAETIMLMCDMGLIRQSRCGLSYRITPKGYEMLQKCGFDYTLDKQYRGKGAVLTRRLETSEITRFFWRYGANVFLDAPNTENVELSFLPSFVLRRKTYANVLGGTRLAGFLYTTETVFIPYYISPESQGIYANAEHRTFRAESLLCGRNPFVIYTGQGNLETLIHTITLKRYKKEKSTTDTFLSAMEKFDCPTAIVPMNECGMRQLRILSVPNYKEKLLRQILGKDCLPPVQKYSDGLSKKMKDNFIIGIDCNIMRFSNAINQADGKIHIILLLSQAHAIQSYLKGRNAILHPIEDELAEQILGIPRELPMLDLTPFKTEKGDYLYGTSFRTDKKSRRTN